MQTISGLTVILVTALLAATGGQSGMRSTLSAEEIQDAIAIGKRGKPLTNMSYSTPGSLNLKKANMGGPDIYVWVTGPFGRIADASHRATKDFRPFSASDVTVAMMQQTLDVLVTPNPDHLPLASVRRVIVAPVGTKNTDVTKVVQPISFVIDTHVYANMMGGKFQGDGAVASFNFSDLPKPPFDIIVIKERGDERRKVDAGDLQKLRITFLIKETART